MTRRSLPAVLLIAVFTLSACGGSAPDSAASPSTTGLASTDTAQPSTGGDTDGADDGGNGNGGGSRGDEGFKYIPWGPDDAPIPARYASLAASPGGPPQCESVRDTVPEDDAFWSAVVAVCLAMSGNGPWPPSAAPDPPAPENDYMDCLNRDIAAMLRRALDWHTRNPNKLPKVAYPRQSGKSSCQTHLYNVEPRTTTPGTPPTVPVVFDAPGLDGETDVEVRVDGEPFMATVDDDDPGAGLSRFVVHVPSAAEPRTVRLRVDTTFGTLSTSVKLPAGDSDLPESQDPKPGSGNGEDSQDPNPDPGNREETQNPNPGPGNGEESNETAPDTTG